ncbi:MAG: DMT family transporter [Pseudomonadota bacterium]
MDIRAILLGLIFAFAWSSAFTSARIIVAEAPPILILSFRFFLSGIIACAIAWWLGQSFRLTRPQWRATIIFGVCQNALYLGLNFVAMQWIEASLAAIIASAMPLIVALAGWMVFGDRVGPLGLAGLLAGMAGVALIMGVRLTGGADLLGIAFCVIGVLALAAATLSLRTASSGGNFMVIVGLQMIIGAVILLPPGLALESWDVTWSLTLIAAFVYTTLVPGLLATIIWFELVNRIGAVKAATFHFLNPFFGVAVAAVLLGEALGWLDILGVVVITLGIWAVQVSRQNTTR